jgi:N-carbamoylputrescine amidase
VNYDIGGSKDQAYYGSSMFVSPKAEILAEAGSENDEIIYADIDVSVIPQLRTTWGFFRDRRPDIYGSLAE